MRRFLLPVAIAIAAAVVPASADASIIGVYWTERSDSIGSIRRLRFSTSQIDTVVAGLRGPHGVALDATGGKVYWTESLSALDSVRRANFDGTGVETIIGVGTGASDIGLDAAGAQLFFTHSGSSTQQVWRSSLDGSNAAVVVGNLNTPVGVDLDPANQKVYWGNHFSNQIERRSFDGSPPSDSFLNFLPDRPLGIALDLTSELIYWSSDRGVLRRAKLDGTGIEVLSPRFPFTRDIALDREGGYVFFTNEVDGKIQRFILNGPPLIEDVAVGISRPRGIALEYSVHAIPEASSIVVWSVLLAICASVFRLRTSTGTKCRKR